MPTDLVIDPLVDEAYQATLRVLMGAGFEPAMDRFALRLREAQQQLAMDLDRPERLKLVHNLAGTGGMLGFSELSRCAALLQQCLLAGGSDEAGDYRRLLQALERTLARLDGEKAAGRPQPSSSS
ncbi:Hpt domain-containing protein [Arboricoccus pini]|uniref:Hpt domain-containing protein n=1 Tax=Arboricoccus pini TaxID=1963835 RepID=A0A212R3U2_9PROT|nr:Hpt domain-containing protein [Arboricoccus pini]SNB66721.1 Hpt domain-containing protein [Arboricoccus pini]